MDTGVCEDVGSEEVGSRQHELGLSVELCTESYQQTLVGAPRMTLHQAFLLIIPQVPWTDLIHVMIHNIRHLKPNAFAFMTHMRLQPIYKYWKKIAPFHRPPKKHTKAHAQPLFTSRGKAIGMLAAPFRYMATIACIPFVSARSAHTSTGTL